jgi:hypothetical protein
VINGFASSPRDEVRPIGGVALALFFLCRAQTLLSLESERRGRDMLIEIVLDKEKSSVRSDMSSLTRAAPDGATFLRELWML